MKAALGGLIHGRDLTVMFSSVALLVSCPTHISTRGRPISGAAPLSACVKSTSSLYCTAEQEGESESYKLLSLVGSTGNGDEQ